MKAIDPKNVTLDAVRGVAQQAELVPAKGFPEGAPADQRALAVRGEADTAYDTIMRAAADERCDPEKFKQLLAVRREWKADEAAEQFNAAVVRFQQKCPIIEKGDTANGRAYARMDRIWRAVRPLLLECGLAVTWESVHAQGDVCVLDGHLRHAAGHAQALHREMPFPDKLNGQNATQRAGSGETYCKRYATCAALGVQTGEDDDGNAGSGEPVITEAQARELETLCEAAGRKVETVCKAVGKPTLEEFPAAAYDYWCKQLAKAANGARP